MQKVKGFTYDTVKDREVVDYIDRQGNGSKYIWDLVRKDMEQNNIESVVRRIMDGYMKTTKENSPELRE